MPTIPVKTITGSLSISLRQESSSDGSISGQLDTRCTKKGGINTKKEFDPGDRIGFLVFLPKNAVSKQAFPSAGSCSWGGSGLFPIKGEKLKLNPGDRKSTLTLSKPAAGSVSIKRESPNNTTEIKSTTPAADGITLYTKEPGRGWWVVDFDTPYTELWLTVPPDHDPKEEIEIDLEADIPSDEDEC